MNLYTRILQGMTIMTGKDLGFHPLVEPVSDSALLDRHESICFPSFHMHVASCSCVVLKL